MTQYGVAALRRTLAAGNAVDVVLPSNSGTRLDVAKTYATTYSLGGERTPRTLGGSAGTDTFNGALQVDVFTPATSGDGGSASAVDRVLALYPLHRVHADQDETVSVRVTRAVVGPYRIETGHAVQALTLYWEMTLNR